MAIQWVDKWDGGRVFLADKKQARWVIERQVGMERYSITTPARNEQEALGELALFMRDPEAYARGFRGQVGEGALLITQPLIDAYLLHIADRVIDHRRAREKHLKDWMRMGLDLRGASILDWKTALRKFDGGHKGRVESLNAFARWLVAEGRLDAWKPVTAPKEATVPRGVKEAYSVDDLHTLAARLRGRVRDAVVVRALTGLHHTELEQVVGAKVTERPLPDKGVWVRTLGPAHEIRGVLQVVHKSRRIHRQSLDGVGLAAVLRLKEAGVPDRVTMWEAMSPLLPSNLRHTFVTLAGECGELVTWAGAGVDRARVAQVVGHRAGSTMTADRYDKAQVPPLIRLPLRFDAP